MAGHEDIQEVIRDLYSQFCDEIYRYALYMLSSPTDARDAVQETFLRVVRGFAGYRQEAEHRTWLWAIARRCVADVRRDRTRRTKIADSVERSAHHQRPGALDSLVELEEVIYRLPVDQREVVILRFLEDLSTEETATVLGWHRQKVRNVLHKAVIRIRKELSDDWRDEGGVGHGL